MPESQQPPDGVRIMTDAIIKADPRLICDVGAGDGKWGRLLRGHVCGIVALEVWPGAAEEHKLGEIYDEVIIADAREYSNWNRYDMVIFGDALEHMTREQSTNVIGRLKRLSIDVFLTIPITPCPQDGAVYDNPYETHLDQWTDEELRAFGWSQLHVGPNPSGKVMVGTYRMEGR